MVTISTANALLDGGGAITDLITGSTTGTLVKTLFIKAQTDTVEGMVRCFVKNSSGYKLLKEFIVLPVAKTGSDRSFQVVVPINFRLA